MGTVFEATFHEPVRMIRKSDLLENNTTAHELSKDIDSGSEGAAEVSVKEGRLHAKNSQYIRHSF